MGQVIDENTVADHRAAIASNNAAIGRVRTAVCKCESLDNCIKTFIVTEIKSLILEFTVNHTIFRTSMGFDSDLFAIDIHIPVTGPSIGAIGYDNSIPVDTGIECSLDGAVICRYPFDVGMGWSDGRGTRFCSGGSGGPRSGRE